MKKLSILVVALATSVSSIFANNENEKTLKVNKKVSEVEWVGKKVTGQHNGTVGISKGEVFVNGDQLMRGSLMLDMKNIVCLDLEGEYNDKFIGHMHSDDFFSTETYPTATFTFNKVEAIEGGETEATHNLVGELTIKGQTHPLTVPAEVYVRDNGVVVMGTVTVDRTLYDIKYGSASFFEGLGDKAIDNEFTITFKVGAK